MMMSASLHRERFPRGEAVLVVDLIGPPLPPLLLRDGLRDARQHNGVFWRKWLLLRRWLRLRGVTDVPKEKAGGRRASIFLSGR